MALRKRASLARTAPFTFNVGKIEEAFVMNGTIIGAGIGGLSTAIALQMRGIGIKIFEAARNLSPIGAGILVPPNAMAILSRYKLSQKLHDRGYPIDALVVMDSRGSYISKTPAVYSQCDGVYRTVAIHRGALQQILLEALDSSIVTTGYECVQANSSSQRAEAVFKDGSKCSGDFLIGADGIHSKIRESIFPNSPLRYSGQTCWRGIAHVDLPSKWKWQLTEMWGNGSRFGFVQISAGQAYWYATKRADQSRINNDRDAMKAQLLNLYRLFSDPVRQIIEQTQNEAIIRDDINDLAPLKTWFSNTIMLIGDAAHASTPNLGQGSAQAIEDSWVLAEKLALGNSIQTAFKQFQEARFAKVNTIVNLSWQIGKVTNLSNPVACRIRNALFRLTPSFLAKKQSCLIYDVSY